MGEPLVAAAIKTCPDCAEEVKAEARVCRFCGYDFDVGHAPPRVGPPRVSPTPMVRPPPRVGPPTPPARSVGWNVLVAVLAVAAAVIGAVVFRAITTGEASTPSDLADRFPEAGVTCTDFDVITDSNELKALGCAAQPAQIITITTYADRPSLAAWQGLRCDAVVPGLEAGAYVFGDDFVIDIVQGPYPADLVTPPAVETVAQNLADVLGGTAGSYDCTAG